MNINSYSEELSSAFNTEDEYFKKYYQYALSLKGKRIKTVRDYQLAIHHIIPKFWYKQNNLTINNTDNNLVVVTYKEHILLHFLLADYFYYSTTDTKSTRKSLYSIQKILGQILNFSITLQNYDNISEQDRQNFSIRLEEYQHSLLLNKKPYCFINNGIEVKMWNINDPIPTGWKRGKIIRKFRITDGNKETWCYDKNKIPDGWHRSYTPSNAKGRIWITDGVSQRMIYPSEQIPVNWYVGTLNKHNDGMKFITNGVKTKVVAIDFPIPEGWFNGQTKKKTNKNMKHITNGIEGKFIPVDQEIPTGWHLGQNRKLKTK